MATPTRQHSAPPTTHALDVHGISKAYGGTTVVDHVSFSVEEGEIFAILGPNGAGKTTTVESIAGLRTPDAGSIEVFGFDPLTDRDQVRDCLGVQLQESRFQDRLTVREIVGNCRQTEEHHRHQAGRARRA